MSLPEHIEQHAYELLCEFGASLHRIEELLEQVVQFNKIAITAMQGNTEAARLEAWARVIYPVAGKYVETDDTAVLMDIVYKEARLVVQAIDEQVKQ